MFSLNSQLPVSSRSPDATASTTVFIGVTASDGQVTSTAPPEFTSLVTSTYSDGGVITYTAVSIIFAWQITRSKALFADYCQSFRPVESRWWWAREFGVRHANAPRCSSIAHYPIIIYRFSRNKGAVAGVFLIVGIAGAAILLFLFFALRRRRRIKRNERDAAFAASLGPQSRVPFEV